MKPSALKTARKLNIDGPLYVHVIQLEDGTLEFDAAYNREELVGAGQKKIVGVYELVRLEEITGVETVTFEEIIK